MKIRADEHIAQAIVQSVCERILSQGWELSHVIDVGHRGKSDEYWVTQFSNDGGAAILTADKDFYRKPNQVIAIQRTGLKVVYFHPGWKNAKCHLQLAHTLLWWERIEKKLTECKARECWQVPYEWNLTGELTQKAMDFHEAERKVKEAAKKREKQQAKIAS